MTDEKIVVEEIIVDETENIKETKMPAYMITEHLKAQGDYSIFNLNLEQLIFEKMFLLFEKLQPAQKKYHRSFIDDFDDETINGSKELMEFYELKLDIINDLIGHKRLLLQVEGGLKE